MAQAGPACLCDLFLNFRVVHGVRGGGAAGTGPAGWRRARDKFCGVERRDWSLPKGRHAVCVSRGQPPGVHVGRNALAAWLWQRLAQTPDPKIVPLDPAHLQRNCAT